ncbi:MAG TPA: hypothetical protein DCX78_06845 [Nitrospina sp.]|jgi:hypothetical protein|nr:hypothetical protein [Nitrospinaceae bacterium]HAX46527.1 hypothetical protein [Nitrospina sp.]
MLTSMDEAIATPGRKARKQKKYATAVEKELMVGNLRLTVEYYGRDYLRKIFKVTKGRVLHDYLCH